jgi:amidophosphoribosyltransferase
MDLDKPHEECGVFGVYLPEVSDAARITYFALHALQHRGQESCGIVSSTGYSHYSHKAMGLVMQAFTEDAIGQLKGHLAIGHTRYSTAGSSTLVNAQPFSLESAHGPIATAHNGQLTKKNKLRRKLLERGTGMFTSTDSEVIVQMMCSPPEGFEEKDGPDWVNRIKAFMAQSDGAYAMVMMNRNQIYGFRDEHGLRPLCIGKIPIPGTDKVGYALASESCALTTIGAQHMRDVNPGEIICIDKNGITSYEGRQSSSSIQAFCVFEYVYFARPDSVMENQLVHKVRQKLGQQLAHDAPCPDADLVIGVPDSSTPAAIGYAIEAKLPFTEGLTKNRYIGRTFIEPDSSLRQKGVKLKYNALRENLEGKNIVLIDDSLVRGTTLKSLIAMIREQGKPKSIHVRISSPPVAHPCFMGIDMKSYDELIAHSKTVEETCKFIEADSLMYLSHEGMMKIVEDQQEHKGTHCSACFSGNYPLDVNDW